MDEMKQFIRIISVRATEVWDRLFCLSDRERLNLAAPSFKMASNTWASIKWVSQISLKITKCRQAVTHDPTGQIQQETLLRWYDEKNVSFVFLLLGIVNAIDRGILINQCICRCFVS